MTNNKPSGIIVVEREVRKMTDRETLLEIFKRAGMNRTITLRLSQKLMVLILTHKEILKNFYKKTIDKLF